MEDFVETGISREEIGRSDGMTFRRNPIWVACIVAQRFTHYTTTNVLL